MQDIYFLEQMAHFDREVIPERRMHAKGSGAFGTFTVTHDITQYTNAKIFSEIGKQTEMFARFSQLLVNVVLQKLNVTYVVSHLNSILKKVTGT